jgi:hypothetical protein
MGQLGINTTTPAFDLHVIETTNSGLTVERYGGTAGIAFREAGGTQAAPTPSSATIGQIRYIGYTPTGFTSSKVAMEINAAETGGWTANGQGTHLQFYTTATGTTTSAVRFRIAAAGHIGEYSDPPVLSGCGTSPTAVAYDSNGVVSPGSGAAGCTITFATPYFSAPACMVSSRGGVNFTYAVTATGITVTGAVGGTQLDFICRGF